jgi:hypothetical protein
MRVFFYFFFEGIMMSEQLMKAYFTKNPPIIPGTPNAIFFHIKEDHSVDLYITGVKGEILNDVLTSNSIAEALVELVSGVPGVDGTPAAPPNDAVVNAIGGLGDGTRALKFVTDIAERDSLTPTASMLVYVKSDNALYAWSTDTAAWTTISSGSSSNRNNNAIKRCPRPR